MPDNETLKKNMAFIRSLDLLSQVESLIKGYKNPVARGKARLILPKIERIIFEEFGVTPEAQRILKDEILQG